MKSALVAKVYSVRGRVQGVGFRVFVDKVAQSLGISGYVRNLDDGTVETYAVGTPEQLAEFAGFLWKGPHLATVRGVDEKEAAVDVQPHFRVHA